MTALSTINSIPLSFSHCIPDPLIVFDPIEGKVLFANDLFAFLLEYSIPELMKKRITDLDLHIPDLLTWQAQTTALKHNGRVQTQSLYRKKNGDMLPVEISTVFCRDATECVVSVVHDISQFIKQTEKISISLQEKEHLLKEIHHRVKNNLQTISSLLSLGSKKIKSESVLNVLQESQNRIHAIATVHEILYKSDMAGRVDMSKYLKYLIASLIDSFGPLAKGVNVNLNTQKLFFLMDTAMPCGLIVNELITNAIQHAFTKDTAVKVIDIALYQNTDGQITLSVKDSGIGFHPDNENEEVSVGLKMVTILAKQLDGELKRDDGEGTTFRVLFNAPDVIKEEE
ncbi:MAG: histidine kinase dimerization/phosphoacceptor domain -containing protein [Sulfuricurvum sp.]|nr:histidine kinase dimerization/phosphoacceptor domain -containing protein [Sulfuricurvum sp.]